MVDAGKIRKQHNQRGFTLIELVIVMAIIAVLTTIAIPGFVHSVKSAKEAVLREDLHTMRSAIDSYTIDKEKAPQSLDDLVQAGYLKTIPIDPITNHNDTWVVGQTGDDVSISEIGAGGINDVHSGAQSQANDGSLYSTW